MPTADRWVVRERQPNSFGFGVCDLPFRLSQRATSSGGRTTNSINSRVTINLASCHRSRFFRPLSIERASAAAVLSQECVCAGSATLIYRNVIFVTIRYDSFPGAFTTHYSTCFAGIPLPSSACFAVSMRGFLASPAVGCHRNERDKSKQKSRRCEKRADRGEREWKPKRKAAAEVEVSINFPPRRIRSPLHFHYLFISFVSFVITSDVVNKPF